MSVVSITDRARLRSYLERNRALHVYELGDLDDFFFPQTRWFGWEQRELEALCLLYKGNAGATLLAFAEPTGEEPMRRLIGELRPTLPDKFHAHLTPSLAQVLSDRYRFGATKQALKLALRDFGALAGVETVDVVAACSGDVESLRDFYRVAYPENWFDPRMLDTGRYCGVRDGDRWIAAAGVHVYSRAYKVAALGNIAVAEDARGRGLGTQVTAALCKTLLAEGMEVVGLNVMRDNQPALACYYKLGFETAAAYEELAAQVRSS